MTNPAPSVLLQHIRRLAGGEDLRSDRELLERFAAEADEASFAELVRRHGPMVLRVCRRLLASPADAEDAFQAVFLVLARKAGAVRKRDSVGGFLYGVACHVARRARDAAARRAAHEGRAPAPPAVAGPVDELTAREWFAALDEELERLPEKERAPLVLCYLEGLTRDEAARRLGCPLGTLKDRLERGKERLRRALSRRGVSLPAGLAVLAAAQTAEAAVPAALAEAAVRAALAGGGSAAAAALAGAVLSPPLATRLTALALLVLLSGAVASGVGLLAQKPAEEKAPAAPPLAAQAPPPRTDLYGDPLPEGAVARLGSVRLRHRDTATGKERAGELGPNRVLALSPDGSLLAAGDAWGRSVRLWELTGRLRGVLPVREKYELLYHLVFSPDSRTLRAAYSWGFVQTWDVAAAKEQRSVQLQEVVWKMAQLSQWPDFFLLSPDARHVLATDGNEGTLNLSIWDTAAGKPRWRHELPGDCTYFSALWVDGRTVALHGLDDGLRLLDVETGAVHWRIPGTAFEGRPLAVSADGRLLATDREKGMDVWETATGKQVASTAAGAWPKVALTPNGRFLVAADAAALRVWDLATGKERRRWPLPPAGTCGGERTRVLAMVLTPNGRQAITALSDGTALVWDLTPALAAAAPPAPGEKEIARWWKDLAAGDAGKAYAAVWRLTEAPAAALPMLRQHLRPATDLAEARRRIAQLDDDAFAVREKASERLDSLGAAAVPALRQALAAAPSAEARRRIEALLAKQGNAPPSGEHLRLLRALAVLEHAETPAARRLLEELAAGLPEAPQTREARAVLTRLGRRAASE